jgi:DNA-binding transcriptional LysR family regulator
MALRRPDSLVWLCRVNHEALTLSSGKDIEGVVRLGVPADFAEGWLSSVLPRFARACPLVRVNTAAARSLVILSRFKRGELDLAMTFETASRTGSSSRRR